MKRILATTLASTVLVGSLAFAGLPLQFTFEDSGFDYAARDDASPAYVELTRDEGGLRLTLTQDATRSTLPVVTVAEVPDTNEEDRAGNDVLATVEDLEEIELLAFGSGLKGFSLAHENVNFFDAVNAYVATIEDLGFASERLDATSNLRVYAFEDDGVELRAVFRRSGDTFKVYLESL